jgi:hypothetical protein
MTHVASMARRVARRYSARTDAFVLIHGSVEGDMCLISPISHERIQFFFHFILDLLGRDIDMDAEPLLSHSLILAGYQERGMQAGWCEK